MPVARAPRAHRLDILCGRGDGAATAAVVRLSLCIMHLPHVLPVAGLGR